MMWRQESDFLDLVPSIPHLHGVRLSICYRELPEHESQLKGWSVPAKWKQDADAHAREGFAPRNKYYLNGQLVGEDKPGHYKAQSCPFPERRVPRRSGIVAVAPEEPDYARLCIEQGLEHLLTEQQKLLVQDAAAHLTPKSMASNDTAEMNGNLSPSAPSPTAMPNGVTEQPPPAPPPAPLPVLQKPLVNGINGSTSGEGH